MVTAALLLPLKSVMLSVVFAMADKLSTCRLFFTGLG